MLQGCWRCGPERWFEQSQRLSQNGLDRLGSQRCCVVRNRARGTEVNLNDPTWLRVEARNYPDGGMKFIGLGLHTTWQSCRSEGYSEALHQRGSQAASRAAWMGVEMRAKLQRHAVGRSAQDPRTATAAVCWPSGYLSREHWLHCEAYDEGQWRGDWIPKPHGCGPLMETSTWVPRARASLGKSKRPR